MVWDLEPIQALASAVGNCVNQQSFCIAFAIEQAETVQPQQIRIRTASRPHVRQQRPCGRIQMAREKEDLQCMALKRIVMERVLHSLSLLGFRNQQNLAGAALGDGVYLHHASVCGVCQFHLHHASVCGVCRFHLHHASVRFGGRIAELYLVAFWIHAASCLETCGLLRLIFQAKSCTTDFEIPASVRNSASIPQNAWGMWGIGAVKS